MAYDPGQNRRFNITFSIALGLHLLIIFGVAISLSSSASSARKEVTLSITQQDDKPKNAEFMAQNNQLGSSDERSKQELTTDNDALFTDTKINETDPLVIPKQALAAEQPPISRIVTTSSYSPLVVKLDLLKELEIEQENNGEFETQDLTELSMEIASLEARLADRQQRLTDNPKTRVLTSTSTMAADDAKYVHQWRNRIETIGNLHYPKEARNQNLYGDVRLLVKLRSNGVVEETTILSTSGHAVLDSAAINSIRLASPFEPFPKHMAEKYDRLDVIRTWQFRKDRLSSTAN